MEQTKTLTVTEQKVARIQADIALSDALVEKVLEIGIDYGIHPGTSSYALKDPGANTIINAFNCYPKAEVLFREVSDIRISYVIDISLVSREDGLVKSTGTGACTTQETRYGYRWVDNPESYGYARESSKKRTRDDRTTYRIVNPDWAELENTILKLARKRGEVDAAMALPGVSRFLAKLNAGRQPAEGSGRQSDKWTGFWSQVKAMGLSEDQARHILGVKSMKEWEAAGHTLNDAIKILIDELALIKSQEEG